jgi:hypothetical protein
MPRTGAPPPPAFERKVILAQGSTAPAGYRYAVTPQAFPANSAVTVTCHDSVDPGRFYTFTMYTDGSGNAFVQNQCYSRAVAAVAGSAHRVGYGRRALRPRGRLVAAVGGGRRRYGGRGRRRYLQRAGAGHH